METVRSAADGMIGVNVLVLGASVFALLGALGTHSAKVANSCCSKFLIWGMLMVGVWQLLYFYVPLKDLEIDIIEMGTGLNEREQEEEDVGSLAWLPPSIGFNFAIFMGVYAGGVAVANLFGRCHSVNNVFCIQDTLSASCAKAFGQCFLGMVCALCG